MMTFIENNSEFMFGIYSGLTVAFLIFVFGKLMKFIKRFFSSTNVVNVYQKSKIMYIYENQAKADKHILEDAKQSNKIYILAFYETPLSDVTSEWNKLLKTKNGDIKILYSNPNGICSEKRINELNISITSEIVNSYSEGIKILQKNNNSIKLSFFDEFIRFKFFIFDDVMYLGFRLKHESSDNLQIYKINKDSYLYKAFLEQFNDYWEKYKAVL